MRRPFPAYTGSEPYTFVSYAHSDAERVYPLLEALRERGVNIWYDEGIEPGKSWREELATAIADADCVLVFVTPASLSSRNCLKELNFALSHDCRIALAYLEDATLPPALELSLGDEQAVYAGHYDDAGFVDKLTNLVNHAHAPAQPSPSVKQIRPRKAIWVASAVAVIIVGAALLALLKPDAPDATATDSPLKIAVATFRNLSGNADLDWFAEGLAGLISDQLADSRHTALVSRTRWSNMRKTHPDKADLYAAAKQSGIRYVVSGEILKSPDGVILSTRVSDLSAGVDVGARTFDAVDPQSFVALAKEVTQAIRQPLNLPLVAQLETLSADFVASSFTAHQAYVAGLSYYNRFEFDQAVASMQTALIIDPGFHMARARLANIELSQGDWAAAQESLAQIPADADLSRRERAYIDGLRFMAANDYPPAIRHFETFLVEYPYDIEAQQFLAESHFRNFDTESAITLLKSLARQEPENHHVWASMGYMLMSIERYEDAQEALETYANLAPELPHPWELLGSLALHRHQLGDALTHYSRSLSIEPGFALSMLGKARASALSGNYPTAHEILTRLAADASKSPRDRISATFDLVSLLQVEGRYDELDNAFAQVESELVNEGIRLAMSYSTRGLAAQQLDNVAQGRDLIAKAIDASPAGGVPTRYLFARGLFELAGDEYESIPVTAAEIRAHALPSDNPDRTEERAALYLEGNMLSALGRHDEALARLKVADQLEGYEYRSVKTTLAHAEYEAGDLEAALQTAQLAFTERDNYLAGDLRLDLEFDRLRALELSITLACALRQRGQARKLADRARKQWPGIATTACVD